MSRTIRRIFWKVAETDTIRRDMDTSWSWSVRLRSCLAALVKLSSFKPSRSGEAVTMDSVMTISPTTAFSSSSFERFTLIRLSFWLFWLLLFPCWAACWGAAGALCWAAACWGAGSAGFGAGASGASGSSYSNRL